MSSIDESIDIFAPVNVSIRLDRLPLLAASVRKLNQKTTNLGTEALSPIDCTVLSPPLFGSFHILFPLQFDDGAVWVLKVPATGHRGRFDEFDAQALTSEALTMQLIKRETTVPIPKVYSFNASIDNELNCPFILMEHLNGAPLYDCWFDNTSSKTMVEQRRSRILGDVATAMVQLNKFTYTQGGRLLFDKDGNPTSIGPMRKLDLSSMLDGFHTDDSNDTFVFCELEPFTNSKAFLLCMLDRREPPPDKFSQGIYKLLRFFIDWFPYNDCAKEEEFVLSHPDLDIQNVLVSQEGRLCGLIDWDGVGTVPRCVGNERYPSWLTRDWDPAKYGYGHEGEGADTGCSENSPEELALYRAMYLQFMERCLTNGDRSKSGVVENPSNNISLDGSAKLTRNSIIFENLKIAADDPVCTHEIVNKIFDEIAELVREAHETAFQADQKDAHGNEMWVNSDDSNIKDNFYLYEVACDLIDENLDQRRLRWLKGGFEDLCS